jgi:hypothetical protein
MSATTPGTATTARQRFGGVKPGASFLGFAAAYGIVTMVTGVVVSVAVATGRTLVPPTSLNDLFARPDLGSTPASGLVALGVGLAAVLLAYYLGGYVAGRMARFDGARQGVAVWVWGLLVGVVTALLSFALAGQLAGMVDALVRTPPTVLLGVVVVLVVQLLGAVLGGLAGMRFHRRVDRAEAGEVAEVRTDPGT